jgi:hypothetical protein
MKRIVAVTLAAAALAVPAAQAHAAAPKAPTLAQFNALQKQVKALQKLVKTVESDLTATQAVFSFLFACHDVVIADEFQGTWNVIDQISAATQAGKTYFGPQTSISDANSCALFKFTRPSAVPPSAAIFSSLVTLLTG